MVTTLSREEEYYQLRVHRVKILVVEDDFASRQFLIRWLMEIGEVDVAISGTEALEAFSNALGARSPYDLVTLDIMMPDVAGADGAGADEGAGVLVQRSAEVAYRDDDGTERPAYREGGDPGAMRRLSGEADPACGVVREAQGARTGEGAEFPLKIWGKWRIFECYPCPDGEIGRRASFRS